MQICPVCGKPANEAAPSSEYDGKTYYFACPRCKDEFDRHPKRYVSPADHRRTETISHDR